MRDDPDRLWEVLKAYQALCNRLFDECLELRTQAPEEGGWVRTTNTAYRAPSTPEVPPEVPEAEEGPENAPRRGRKPLTLEQRNNISNATQGVPKKCSRCGREGVNVRTCVDDGKRASRFQKHRQPIKYIPKSER
jgi:hypothetical protein